MKDRQIRDSEIEAALSADDLQQATEQLLALRQLSEPDEAEGELPQRLQFAAIRDQLPIRPAQKEPQTRIQESEQTDPVDDAQSQMCQVATDIVQREQQATDSTPSKDRSKQPTTSLLSLLARLRQRWWISLPLAAAACLFLVLWAKPFGQQPPDDGLKGADCCGDVRLRLMRAGQQGPIPLHQRRVPLHSELSASFYSDRSGWLQLVVVDLRQRTVTPLFRGQHRAGRRMILSRRQDNAWTVQQVGRFFVLAIFSERSIQVSDEEVLALLRDIGHRRSTQIAGQPCSCALVTVDGVQSR